MPSVGSELRQTRTSLGLTLEQVSAKTRISVKNLEALEEDNLSLLPSAFFYRSYVRQFAGQLNLDYDKLSDAVQRAASTMPEPLMPGQVAPGQEQTAPKLPPVRPPRRPRTFRWLSSVASLFVMLIACSSFYAVWQKSRWNWRGELQAIVTLFSPNHTDARQNLAQISPGIPQPPPADAPSEPATAPVAVWRLELSATERTWISIIADGKQTFSGVLEPQETKVLENCSEVRVRTGNAGGVAFVFNGKSLGSLGARGQVRTVVFTKDAYEVLSPADASSTPNAE